MSWYPCPYQNCLDNVRGQCFAEGCWRNPRPEYGYEGNETKGEEDDD